MASAPRPRPEDYFNADSMIRRIHGERAVAISGARALLMQAAHPLAVFGLLSHSSALEEPYDRLGRTAQVMNTIVFGTRAEADRIGKRIRAMHRRVSGRLPNAIGPYPAGTPYRADDPDLLLWVLYTLVDSAAVVYSRYVRPLSVEQRAAFWEDYKVVGKLFGLRRGEMPATLADLDAYGRRMLDGDQLLVTDWARERARQIVLSPPVPALARPALETANFVTIALLPNQIREQYRFSPLPPPALRRALVAGGARYFRRAVLPFLPGRIRLTPGARAT
jgi:uncharacterized protein (DUF2236 family)